MAWAFAVVDARCDALFDGPHFAQACDLALALALSLSLTLTLTLFDGPHLAQACDLALALALTLTLAIFDGPHFAQACERHSEQLLRGPLSLSQLELWRQWRDACSADGRTWPTLPAPLLVACQASSEAKGAE